MTEFFKSRSRLPGFDCAKDRPATNKTNSKMYLAIRHNRSRFDPRKGSIWLELTARSAALKNPNAAGLLLRIMAGPKLALGREFVAEKKA